MKAAGYPLSRTATGENAPSWGEIVALVAAGFAVFVLVTTRFRGYADAVDRFGDSSAYMALASAIRRWDFTGVAIKQFWGLPYAMAALSKLTGLSGRTSLLIFSLLPSGIAALLARRLWDGWIAGYFAILNFDWLQRSCLGGSEPLFVALLFGAFLAVRRERWLLAALLGAFATVVRPLGIFALIGVGLVLLLRRDFKKFAAATAIGLTIGVLYSLPLARHFGDPLATVNSYHSREWQGGWLFGIPFYAIIKGTMLYSAPLTNLALSFAWILLVVLGVVAMVSRSEFRTYSRDHLVEAIFLVPYLWCIFSYNYPVWARSNFARFAIPILPFVLLALDRWIPRDRRLLWFLGLATPVLAACSAIGIANALRLLRAHG